MDWPAIDEQVLFTPRTGKHAGKQWVAKMLRFGELNGQRSVVFSWQCVCCPNAEKEYLISNIKHGDLLF